MPDLFWTIMAWVIAPALMIYMVWNYFQVKKAANYVSNEEFKALLRTGQLIDIREPGLFKKSHILGARNFPMGQLTESLSALRKDKPVLIYDNARSQHLGRAAIALNKAGFKEVYALRDGFEAWDGKIK